jgi:hypothetical protein
MGEANMTIDTQVSSCQAARRWRILLGLFLVAAAFGLASCGNVQSGEPASRQPEEKCMVRACSRLY